MPGLNSIDGLNSGLQTGDIIDSIMAVERRGAVLLEQQQAETTNIISSYKALQAKFLALNTELIKLSQEATFNAASTSVSDESYASAEALGQIAAGTYDIQILSLARNHQIASRGITEDAAAVIGTGTISIAVGNGSAQTITVDSGNNSLVGIRKAINDAKLGVRASIVNDGSDSNSFRLVLSANDPGLKNKISFSSSLTGGEGLDFANSSFDNPEMLNLDPASSSTVSLGTTASFSGKTNKVFTFTVGGTGVQTIGSDVITIDWTDGSNSGSIVVSQADVEEQLIGTGAEGLKLSFSSGTLTAGDSFQVTTFAPTLQEASNAKIAYGSSGGAGSPIVVTSDSNTFDDVIPGIRLKALKETPPGETVSIGTEIDTAGIKSKINAFISKYNDIMTFIDKQNTFNEDQKEVGVLFGDQTVWMMQESVRRSMSTRIEGITSDYNQLGAIGIRTGLNGHLAIKDSSRLEEALKNNLDDIKKLFTNAGNTSSDKIQFMSAGAQTKAGEAYNVDITQAATRGRFQGGGIAQPSLNALVVNSSNNRLKLNVDGAVSNEIVLTERTYSSSAELVKEIQDKIDNDSRIGSRGLTVEWIDSGSSTGYLQFNSSTYGSTSTVRTEAGVSNNALAILGLATGSSQAGNDVEGTIHGEKATGIGQILTGNDDNKTTAGLKLRITFEGNDLASGAEGTFTLSKGVAARLRNTIESFTKSGDGTFDRRLSSYNAQIKNIAGQIEDIDERLALRRESLFKRFYEMEVALGQLNSESSYLSNQLASINANWKSSKSGR